MWPHGALAIAWVVLILLLGAGVFGRSSTQRWIDGTRQWPWVNALLNRYHGELRASFHYVEFGGLSLILYLVFRQWWSEGLWSWQACLLVFPPGVLIAYLDEKRQAMTPGRQFRMVDFWHSIKGLVLMQVVIGVIALVRYAMA